MNTINSSNFLLPNIADKLCSYQKERVSLMINDFIEINKQMDSYHFEYCPKCGAYHPVLVKAQVRQKQGNRCLSAMHAIKDLSVIMVS